MFHEFFLVKLVLFFHQIKILRNKNLYANVTTWTKVVIPLIKIYQKHFKIHYCFIQTFLKICFQHILVFKLTLNNCWSINFLFWKYKKNSLKFYSFHVSIFFFLVKFIKILINKFKIFKNKIHLQMLQLFSIRGNYFFYKNLSEIFWNFILFYCS